VIADDESEIIEAARRMSKNYDFVVTSGGIGPTHDDITYPALAKAFDSPLALHEETAKRMREIAQARPNAPPFDWDTPSPMLTARMRMAMLPTGPGTKVYFVAPDLWVPIAVVGGNVHILPGVPKLFVQLLEGLRDVLIAEGRVDRSRKALRVMISTPMQESEVAEYLTELQEKVKERGVKVGSYPRWGASNNTITLVGSDTEYVESLVPEVEKATKGVRVAVEGEDDKPEDKQRVEVEKNAEAINLGGAENKDKHIPSAIPEQTGVEDAVKELKV
jgi:molybdopterin-biosynthesis enzyme MoeA-like protein